MRNIISHTNDFRQEKSKNKYTMTNIIDTNRGSKKLSLFSLYIVVLVIAYVISAVIIYAW